MGVTCLSSVAAAIFDSIKNRPAKKKQKNYHLELNAGKLSKNRLPTSHFSFLFSFFEEVGGGGEFYG